MYRTRGARGDSKLNRTLHESPATASLHSATPKRKNVSCSFDFRGGGFFLKWKGHFSFWGSARKDIRAVWRGFNSDSGLRKLFSGGGGGGGGGGGAPPAGFWIFKFPNGAKKLYNVGIMEKYLENHLESPPLSQKEFNSAKESQKELRNLFPENVLRNLHSEFEYRENDTQRIELQEGGSLTFSYEMVTPELINELRILFRDVGTSLIQDLENGKFRRISKFVIETGSGRRLDFSTLPVRNIFFTIDNNDWVKNIA